MRDMILNGQIASKSKLAGMQWDITHTKAEIKKAKIAKNEERVKKLTAELKSQRKHLKFEQLANNF